MHIYANVVLWNLTPGFLCLKKEYHCKNLTKLIFIDVFEVSLFLLFLGYWFFFYALIASHLIQIIMKICIILIILNNHSILLSKWFHYTDTQCTDSPSVLSSMNKYHQVYRCGIRDFKYRVTLNYTITSLES